MTNNLKQSLMMKKITMITFLLLGLFTSAAQAQQSVNAAGGEATGSGGSISYTIGQIDYTCYEGTGGTVSQGVQQLSELSQILSETVPKIDVVMIAYPNPTTDLVNLKIENYNSLNLTYALFDIGGKQIIPNKEIKQDETQIQMNNLPSTTYLLSVFDGNKLVKTFKIIKKN